MGEKTAKKPTKDEKVAKEIVASVEKVLAKVTGGSPKLSAKEEKEAASWDLGAARAARKAAEMPDHGMSADELAAMRAKAKGNQMTEEQKKERGLLYDTSKAQAVREDSDEDDDGAADMDGGFDWE